MSLLARRGVMGRHARLPKEYQEVEYIKGDGNAYINAKKKATPDSVFNMRILFDEFTGNYWYCGAYNGALNRDSFAAYLRTSSRYFSAYTGGVATINDNIRAYTDTPYDVILRANELKVNETTFTTVGEQLETRQSYFIFAVSNAEDVTYNVISTMRLYYFNETINGVYVRNYVPCYRKSDGVIGMYDLCGSICPLTGTPFYINAGTGEFTKGVDVN